MSGVASHTGAGPREETTIEYDVIVLTQSCDLQQAKVRLVATCPIFPLGKVAPMTDLCPYD
jgi:hypothetical protein